MPKLDGTFGRDLPEPKGIKDPSIRPDKIQIALSIYHSILAQASITARLSTPSLHIGTSAHPNPTCVRSLETARNLPQQHRNHTRHLARLHTLGTFPRHFPGPGSLAPFFSIQVPLSASPLCTMQGEKEETERLEQEEKRDEVIAPALRLVKQARLGTLPSDAAWPVRSYRYGARPEH